ncbi:MAG: hypothetical protein OXH46_02125 [Gemmatimonadetes bacterium]|nr:hypothetical protein [Gemmatimonadota bacterium]
MSREHGEISSTSRSRRVEVPAANRSRPPSSARWPGTVPCSVALGLAGVIGLAGCGHAPEAEDDGRIYFSESTSRAYEIGSSTARLDQLDERVSFGSIADVLATPGGYFVADGLDPRIVLLDRNLDPLRILGGEGEGPGEYRFPSRLVRADDRILVLDDGNARVAQLTSEGDFVASHRFPGLARDIAVHPELGLLVAGDASRDHYLARVAEQGHTAFGPIPPELVVDYEGAFQLPVDLVAVTPDGLIHVLDGDQLALVSYRPDGDLVSIVFLPREMRARGLKRSEERVEAFGGRNRVLGSAIVSTLTPLDDGRLLTRTSAVNANGLITKGLVLDLERLEAIPLVFPADRDRTWARGARIYLDGLDRAVVNPMWTASLETAPVQLVARNP